MQARETLAEIPDQFTSFMKVQGIKPNPPPLRKQRSSISVQPGQYPGQPGPYPGQPGPYPGQAYAGQQGGPYGGQGEPYTGQESYSGQRGLCRPGGLMLARGAYAGQGGLTQARGGLCMPGRLTALLMPGGGGGGGLTQAGRCLTHTRVSGGYLLYIIIGLVFSENAVYVSTHFLTAQVFPIHEQ